MSLLDPAFNIGGIYPEVKLLAHMVILFLFFEELSHFPKQLCPFCILASSVQWFQLLHILIHPCYFLVLNSTRHNRCQMISPSCFDGSSLMVSDTEHLFMHLLAFSITSLDKCLFSPLCVQAKSL